MTRFSPILLLLAAGCTPNNAELTSGSYLAFFPTDGSPVLNEGRIDLEKEGNSAAVNCSPQIAELDGQNTAACAQLELSDDFKRPHEPWADDDSFMGLHSGLDPWRGEGILTNEGDLQVLFHHGLTGGEDFRFLFVIDPNFQPQRCVQDAGGGSQWEDIDGNWLENWSAGVDGKTRYLLNANSSQINPDAQTWSPANFDSDEWFMPDEWSAGAAVGRYGPSLLFSRRANYEFPWAYAAWNQGFENLPDTNNNSEIQDVDNIILFQKDCADVEALATGIETDLSAMSAGIEGAGAMRLAPIVECNTWREVDESPAGLDDWRGIHYSFVEIDNSSTIEVGGSVTGNFRIVLEGNLSQTVIIVDGEFAIDKVKREKWGNPDLHADLLEESGTQICGGGNGGGASDARIRSERALRTIMQPADWGFED